MSSSGSSPGSSGSTRSSTTSDRRVLLSDLLGHIHVYYKAAIERLPGEELPVLIPRLLEAGVCFGPLDPVSNIIVNTICSCEPNASAQGEAGDDKRIKRGRKRKRKRNTEALRRMRDEAMSEILTDASSISRLPPILGPGTIWKRRTVAQRSLEGLVTFLICYFRHLPVSEALHYLLLAKADLLTAVHLIQCSRGMGDNRLCPVSSPTTLIALRCAAVSASHPEPTIFAARLLSHPQLVPSMGHCLSPNGLNRLHKLLDEALEQTAESRDIKGTNIPIEFPLEFTDTLRSLLLDQIHVLYLKAIAQLPSDRLRRHLHRGLLKGGLCFGPADDPVSNIILNSIWYNTTFPAPVEFKVDMISTKSLTRIECQSLIGLLAFLHNLFPALCEHQAMLYLLHSNASLQKVISRALQDHVMSSSYEDAYKAAAEAAEHPHPDAQAEFAMSKLLPILQSSRGVSCALTSSEVELISSFFSHKSCPGKSVPKLLPRAAQIVSHHQYNFMANQDFISRKVNAALQTYAEEKGTEYELHVICGMNLDVPENGKRRFFRNRKGYPYAHVNFLARRKGPQPDDRTPNLFILARSNDEEDLHRKHSHPDDTTSILFFLECSNVEEDLDRLSPCCVALESPADYGRCFHCEYEGNKIVHPAFGTYHGRETDFEEMARGQRKVDNEDLIGFGKMRSEFVGVLSDDSVYFDPAMDSDFAQWMNFLARQEEADKEFILRESCI